MSNSGTLHTSISHNVAHVTFGHPSGNSFPSSLLHQLTERLYDLSENQHVRIIVLQSEGTGAFCAGASFDELVAVSNLIEGTQFFSGFANVINAMRKCKKIIIGRAQGKAVGGGVGLLSACDVVYATSAAAIKLSEIAIGIGPFVIEPAVSRKIGKTAMSDLALHPQSWKSAQWALEKGLFNAVFDSIESMDKTLINYIETLALSNPEALEDFKKMLWDGTENWDSLLYERASISGKLVLSDFTKNALATFKK